MLSSERGEQDGGSTLCAVLTCHDRKPKTLAALSALYRSAANASVTLRVVLVDDGSADGTGEAVAARFPEVDIVRGSGDLFWNQGMRVGIEAGAQSDPDYFLLLNDDTYLDPDVVARLVDQAVASSDIPSMIVGTTRDPATGKPTYGGRVRPLLSCRLVEPDPVSPVPCDSFNANCVLVSRAAFDLVGNLSPSFTHKKGDFDYGLRARQRGVRLLVAPGTHAECERDKARSRPDTSKGLWADLAHYASDPKEQPLGERVAFYRRHVPWLWWLFVPLAYVSRVGRWIASSLTTRGRT